MTKAKLIRLIDASLRKIGTGSRFLPGSDSGPLPLCRQHDIDCTGCPAAHRATGTKCSGWDTVDEEVLYFCFVRAMVSGAPSPAKSTEGK